MLCPTHTWQVPFFPPFVSRQIWLSVTCWNTTNVIKLCSNLKPGCHGVYMLTQKPNFDYFGKGLKCNLIVHFMSIWYILWPFGIKHCFLLYHYDMLYVRIKIWKPCFKHFSLMYC
jgi:hypothetical protein